MSIRRCYEDLANKIILSAVDDYREALGKKGAEDAVERIESFFLSDWFAVLTSIDGIGLMNRLKKEAGL